ncbi:MAG: dehydrogenase [Alphaproteobacteria bacterium]|nr:MAG: dehydrogenase [Alphaproteobacteria bacterium]
MLFHNELQEKILSIFEKKQIDIDGFSKEHLIGFLKKLLTIRFSEEMITKLVQEKKVGCPCHFCIGQEAPPVGISYSLTSNDRVFGAHRSHGHYLALGGSPYKLFAEVLGKKTGASGGMGGSMHITSIENGFAGSVPIVSGTVPLAVGAGLAAKMSGSDAIGIAYFGDGACEEGVVHESLNAAVVMDIPVLFVVENNLFSSHLDLHLRQPSNRTSRFAEANKMLSAVVDGNDVCEVAQTAQEMIKQIRTEKKPGFIECITYRHLGHVGPDANIDVGVLRKPEDIEKWKKIDPITRLKTALIENNFLTKNQIEELGRSIYQSLLQDSKKAESDPYPSISEIEAYTYTEAGHYG